MADLSITAANVEAASSDCTVVVKQAGQAITRGQAVYLDAADSNKAKLADNDASATTATVYGVAMSNAGADGDYIIIATRGSIEPGATVTKGQLYYLSGTAGGICPYADLGAGDYVSAIYRATSTSVVKLEINNTATQL